MPESTEAAVAIVHTLGPAPSVLLMRRSERDDDPWSGHWSFPGGRRDPVDRTALDTALRELAEECGVVLAPEHLETALPAAVARRRIGPVVRVAPFVFRVDRELPTTPDLREAVEAKWIPVRTFTDPRRHSLTPVPGLAATLLFPSITINGRPLWGFTYRLITNWLGLIPAELRGDEGIRQIIDALNPLSDWNGAIPVDRVLERLTAASGQIPLMNCVEVRPDSIRVTGLRFEEHIIDAQDCTQPSGQC